ncbi:nitrogen fixation protein NifX [Geomesophilobacter sediminis]|uniref:Nitrogen fixation protein NifX n=1 Tax=Geomesophilobacter sediminis TaxID=2798584 RepID=A0A8J7J5F5_9BACT|nr:nitrogen fixation protein NifX [Geomesophilobacter sediminis]MBJ6726253.1 nitrogen fixation protein NifX [Geomesophilobacter sediminis]
MKIAFTSSTGEMIDQHFGMTSAFTVWEVEADKAEYLKTIAVEDNDSDEEDRIMSKAEAIADCAIVYTVRIGGPAAAKLVAKKIHPMKTNEPVPVSDAVARLQEVLQGNPPPWLRKALNKGNTPSFLED